MKQITLNEDEASLARACIDVSAEGYATSDPPPPPEDLDAYDSGVSLDGNVLSLHPESLAAKMLLVQMYECPCADSESDFGFETDVICSLARKLRQVGISNDR